MRKILLMIMMVLVPACDMRDGYSTDEAQVGAPAPTMLQAKEVAGDSGRAARSDAKPRPNTNTYLAYTHTITLETVNTQVSSLMKAHQFKCEALGPAQCLVVGANIQTWDEFSTSASLSLRLKPELALIFLEDVRADAQRAEGRVVSQQTRVDDLTRSIIDNGARLKAQTTLRDRLQALLENQPGKLKELIEIERELARVQGQIDALTSTLKVLRARVDMSSLTITYQSRVQVESAPLQPLKSAFGEFFANFAGALASIVTFFAYALPWTVALIILLFVVRVLWPLLGIRFRSKN